ncbi:hypothetical protein PMAYCL1PPCAC_26905, partial [Pristionchus mayeri]
SPKFIHRGKAIYCCESPRLTIPTFQKISDNVIVIEVSTDEYDTIFTTDSSPFVYVAMHSKDIFVFEARTTKLRETFQIEGVGSVDYIVGVNNGEITVCEGMGRDIHLVTAELPKQLESNLVCASQLNVNKENTMEELVTKINNLQAEINAKDTIIQEMSTSRGSPCCMCCTDRLPNIIFFDCLHAVVCKECFNEAPMDGSTLYKNCPKCGTVIKNSSKILF